LVERLLINRESKEFGLIEATAPPLVSFVVPCYQYGHFLAECVNSIRTQSYTNFEILIMDNCSTDNTPEVAQSFSDGRIQYFRNSSNIGAAQNFNKGLSLARGKYVWVLAADDRLRSSSVLQRYVDAMEQDASLGFVFCRAIELLEETEGKIVRWTDCGDQDRKWSHGEFFPRLIQGCCVNFSSVLSRREVLAQIGFFPANLSFADDWYVWCMLAMNFGAAYFAEPLVYYRVHENSLTNQQGREYARMCAGDELSMLWMLRGQAESKRDRQFSDACRDAMVARAADHLRAGLMGTGRCMSATQFEAILVERIPQAFDRRDIRKRVYQRVADQIERCSYLEDAHMELADEIALFWDLCQQASSAIVPSLCEAGKVVLARRLANRLRSRNRFTGTEFREELSSRVADQQEVRAICSAVYTEIGDRQFSDLDYENATQSYRLALQIRPLQSVTVLKYVLMKLGILGIWVRHFSHQVRMAKRRS
jgi:glycosyltransferase involved in cell wall biosynthesis